VRYRIAVSAPVAGLAVHRGVSVPMVNGRP
jgi:hypothetical protein